MTTTAPPTANPKRVAAGKRNWALRKGLTPAGRKKLRETALKHRPWRYSTGPKTTEGKKRSALNGKKRQLGPRSVRNIRAEVAELRQLLGEMRAAQGS
jgi:hypothetical protein